MRKMMLALGTAMLAVPFAVQAQADMRPTIAVLPFEMGAIQPELGPLSKGFQSMMLVQLGTNTRLRVVERDQIQRILSEQDLSAGGRVDQSTAVRIGKLLGAKYMITGGFITDPNRNMVVTVHAFDTETGQIIYTDGDARGKVDALMDLIVRAANTANQRLNLPQLPAGAARDAANAKTESNKKIPFQAVMLYSRALEAKDKGDNSEAVTLLSQAIDRFPDYEAAKTEKAKLQGTN